MNKGIVSRLLMLAVLSFAFAVFALAQGNESSADEWNRFHSTAQLLLRGTPFRIKMTVETRLKEEDEWTFYSYQEIEQIGPDRTHIRYRKGYYEEVIWIGKTSYSKRPNADWVVKMQDNQPSAGATVPVATVRDLSKKVFVYTNLGNQSLSGEQMTVLKMVVKWDRLNLASGTTDSFPGTTQYWYDRQGRCRRNQTIDFTSAAPGPRFIRTTKDYEYDPSIKIEAPIQ